MNAKINSHAADRALKRLGVQLKTARIKRRISVKDFSERIGASQSTVARLEKGDVGVSIGTLAMACLVLGEIDRINEFFDPATDDTGLSLEQAALPKRIGTKKKTSESSTTKNKKKPPSEGDVNGVGF